DTVVAAAELGAGLGEDGLVAFARLERRLQSSRPEGALFQVAEVTKGTPAIARGVLAPTGDGEVAPTAVTAARMRDGDVVSAVGEQIDFGRPTGGVLNDPHGSLGLGGDAARFARLGDMGKNRRDRLGDALLKQQGRGAKHRIG